MPAQHGDTVLLLASSADATEINERPLAHKVDVDAQSSVIRH
jgi:hypothetical protein